AMSLRVLWREEDRQPAVGDLAGQGHIFRPQNGQEDWDPLLDGPDRQLERLARAVRQRQLQGLAVVLDLLAGECYPQDRDVLARALQLLAEPDAVKALRHLRPGRAEAEDHAATGQVVDRGRGHRA